VLLKECDRHLKEGSLAEAIETCRDILTISPGNAHALRRLRDAATLRDNAALAEIATSREAALLDVAESWTEPAPQREKPLIEVLPGDAGTLPEPAGAALMKRLTELTIPLLEVKDCPLPDFLRHLDALCRDADPEALGVNFVLTGPADSGAHAGEKSPPLAEPPRLTLSLRNITIAGVLNVISSMADISWRADDYAVALQWGTPGHQFTQLRTYHIREPEFFHSARGQGIATVSDELRDRGIPLPQGSTAVFFEKSHALVVNAPADALEMIEDMLRPASQELPQVEIETRFVEFTEDRLNALRTRWQLSSNAELPVPGGMLFPAQGTTGSGAQSAGLRGIVADADTAQSGIFNPPLNTQLGRTSAQPATLRIGGIVNGQGLQAVLDFLQGVNGGRLMSAPRITLKSGEQGRVRIAREFIYPRAYRPPQIANSSDRRYSYSDDSGLLEPANPERFNFDDPEYVGVVLEVTPVVRSQEQIELKFDNVQVREFDGFINFGEAVTELTAENRAAVKVEGVALQPVFSIRRAETVVQLRNGQTIVMGGLMRDDVQTVEDRVPVLGDIPLLGRLFRSEVDQSIKRNLMILTTARLLSHPDAMGEPQAAITDSPAYVQTSGAAHPPIVLTP
jgi:general secretion pathway protein D